MRGCTKVEPDPCNMVEPESEDCPEGCPLQAEINATAVKRTDAKRTLEIIVFSKKDWF
jgi:hypothetical protein